MNKKVLGLLPALLFFLCYRSLGLPKACAILMVSTLIVTGIEWLQSGKVARYSLLNLALVLFFGALTLLGGGVRFLQLKASILYSLLSLLFFVTSWQGKPFLGKILPEQLAVTSRQARQLNTLCGVFFATCTMLNLYLSSLLSEADWITFKVFGMPGLTILFVTGAMLWLRSSQKRSAHND